MNYAYDLHSWSKHYREEALQQAQTRHLVERAQTSREVRGLRRVDLALSNAPTLLRGAQYSEQLVDRKKGCEVRSSSLASRPDSFICPLCEANGLHHSGHDSQRYQSCGGRVSEPVLETLEQITTLPDALGRHACECGHPEMRHLPDGTYHCPACGSEVVPLDAPSTPSEPQDLGEAYWAGWLDGRFGVSGSFVDNMSLIRWQDPYDRLDYYRGHCAGSEARQARNCRNLEAREKLFGCRGARWTMCDSRKEDSTMNDR